MRRRTIQYLVLLSIFGLSVHLYFDSSPFSLFDGLNFDLDPDRSWGGAEGRVDHGGARPPTRPPKGIPPPPKPPVPADPPMRKKVKLEADVSKRDAVVDAFRYAWGAYEKDAFGFDEYHPISHSGSNLGFEGGIGYTVVDALDTMLLMGLTPEYERARKWVKEELSFARQGYYSTFETTIRVLGGLLSAYHFSSPHDPLYLTHAADLGARLAHAFDTSSGLPVSHVNLASPHPGEGGGVVSVAEATTLQLEFRLLAQLTGEEGYWRKAERVMQVVNKARIPNGLAPIEMSMSDGSFARSGIRMGSNGDSYYEYLLKQYLQTNRTEPVYLQMYEDAMQGVATHLVKQTPNKGLTYIAELLPGPGGRLDWGKWMTSWTPQPKQEHLACFLAGSLMLGATTVHAVDQNSGVSVPPRMSELTGTGRRDWKTGVAFLEGCLDTLKTKTGLAPEGVNFRTAEEDGEGQGDPERDWYIKGAGMSGSGAPPYDARYMLRPEISESVFLAWRLTGDVRYRTYAWDIFSAIEKYCKLEAGGYATVVDVDQVPVVYIDKQETFFLSETLKYLFLTFADEDVLDLNEVVFNTEAHPLPIFDPSIAPVFTKYS
ncbi:glycoside hydrolase [Mycena epipterygia]|nr:glycoside hydrolase [Mycena epipterygia]